MSPYIVYTPAIELTEEFENRDAALAHAREMQKDYDTYIYRIDGILTRGRCPRCIGNNPVCGYPWCETCYGPNPRIADR